MNRRRMIIAATACLIGIAILAAGFAIYWPGTKWNVVPRHQLIDKGRVVAKQLGLNVDGWDTYVVANAPKALMKPNTASEPLSVRVTYASSGGGRRAVVGFNSNGLLNYWYAPDDSKSTNQSGSTDATAKAALQVFAGSRTNDYANPVKSAGDDDDEREFNFRNTRNKQHVVVTLKNSSLERVELQAGSDEDDDDGYWDVFSALSGFVYIIGLMCAIGLFILWLVRKALNPSFQLRFAITAFVIMMALALLGSGLDKARSVDQKDKSSDTQIPNALALLVIVAVGRVASTGARPKWMSLEQLFRLAPVAKQTGQSIFAGVLYSPLLAAIPFLIIGLGLIPHSWVLPSDAEILYSRAPLLDSLNRANCMELIFFFGFVLPVLERFIASRWLRWPIIITLGVAFFTNVTRTVSGPFAAPLVAGLLTTLLFWFVWTQFDLLAVLVLEVSRALTSAFLVRTQQRESNWMFIATFLLLFAFAAWIYWRGEADATGDPLATIPSLAGFRAEREKLLAEFSVARRAQQDMLPQYAPRIPGYSLAASCTPSLEVGGDLYDFLKLQDGRIGIGVADVSGKGVPAALYMTLTKGLLSAVAKSSSELGPIVEEVNRHLQGVTRKKVFVTMALGFLDIDKRKLQCVRAGHNPMVWRQKVKNVTSLVAPSGLGLGITAGRIFGAQLKVQEMDLSEGDAVVFYSDGITEAMNRGLEQFGEQRLMDAVDRADSLDAAAAHDSILSEVRGFLDGVHPQDDMTLVVLRVGQ